MFKRLLTAFIGLVALASPAFSQGTVRVCYMASPGVCTDVSSTNPFPVLATVNASITGWPGTTQTTGTPISVTTGGVTGTLPTGAVVVATNDGATNTAYCKLGASSTTSDTPIYPHSSVSFTVGAATQLTCITSTSTTTVNMSGGSGLPTGWGGGSSSGGGGGAITAASGSISSGAYASGSIASGAFASGSIASGALASGAGADGWDVTQGAKADAAWVSGSGSAIAILKNIAGGIAGAIPAGANLIGKVGVDQTTPGTTNGVGPSITNAVWGTTAAMTGTTSTSLIAGTSSKVTYVTAIKCVNSHATVGTFVTVQDGTGGTTLGTLAAAAVFGGDNMVAGGVPLFPPTTSGNGVFVADVTTGANVICTASGFHS